MPIYEYRCLKCGHQFEKMQKIADRPVSKCEKCSERVTRVFHPVAIHFKGSGFYSTDYGKKHSDSRKKSGGKTGGGSGDSGSGEGSSSGGSESNGAGDSGSSKKNDGNSRKKAASGSKES
ncbi:MAG: zinc ribbon domain-containing protein [Thermoleophilia bacterium]|nr:zinc ribbon domain-containing protein [Thermoleophilia bacterium]